MASKDFFLSSDDAQTLGNIDYMRKSVRVRHTFPKTLKNPNGFAIEKEISSTDGRSIGNSNINSSEITSNTPVQPSFQNTKINISSEPAKSTPKKRPQGTSLDLFRNMARNIGKK